MTGPNWVSSSSVTPMTKLGILSLILFKSSSAISPTATTTETAIHLCPAAPKLAETAASADISKSASGKTII